MRQKFVPGSQEEPVAGHNRAESHPKAQSLPKKESNPKAESHPRAQSNPKTESQALLRGQPAVDKWATTMQQPALKWGAKNEPVKRVQNLRRRTGVDSSWGKLVPSLGKLLLIHWILTINSMLYFAFQYVSLQLWCPVKKKWNTNSFTMMTNTYIFYRTICIPAFIVPRI